MKTVEQIWGIEKRPEKTIFVQQPKEKTAEEIWGIKPPTPPSPIARAKKFIKEYEAPDWLETMAKEQRKSFTDPTGLDRQMIAATTYAGAGLTRGLSLGYIDPRTGEVTIPLTRKTSKKFKGIEEIPYLAEADVYKPVAYGAGYVAGVLAPISRIFRATSWMMKGKNVPVVLRAGRAVGVGRPLIRPTLQRLAEAGVAGATYGTLEKPPEKVSRAKNALDMSAWFMTFTGGTMAVDKAVRSLGLGKVRAYQNFRRDMIRIFRKNGYPEKEAQVASDILINKGMTNVYGKEWPKKIPAVKYHAAARRMRTAAKLTEDLAKQAPKVKPVPPTKAIIPTARPPVPPPTVAKPAIVPPVAPEVTPAKLIGLKQARAKFEATGTADIVVGKDYGIAIKDEGPYVSVMFGPERLMKIDDPRFLKGERNFGTPEEAFAFAKKIQDRITKPTPLPIPKELVGKIERPVLKAVSVTIDEGSISSGFHETFSREFNGIDPSWAIVFKGKVSPEVTEAAKESGLKLNVREVYKGAVKYFKGADEAYLTDVYLPNVKQTEAQKAKTVFDKFATVYQQAIKPITPPTIKVIPEEIGPPDLARIHTIDITTDNPLARSFRQRVPLGTTMGSKAAHSKYYTVLFKNSILDILETNPNVTNVFSRSGMLDRVIDSIKPTGVSYVINDLDKQIIAMQNFNKFYPSGLLKGYLNAKDQVLSELTTKTGIPKEAFYSTADFRRYMARTPTATRQRILPTLPVIANDYFKRANAEVVTIDSPDKAGKYLFLQRNSIRGHGAGQAFFTGKGNLKGPALSPLGKPEIEYSIKSQSKYLKKANLSLADGFKLIEKAGRGDFLLNDPPYYQETGYKVTWEPRQTIRLINALDEAHKRGAEFTYHDTYNDTLRRLWESKGYKVYRVRVPSLVGVARVKDEMFVISREVAPAEKPVSFAEKQIGILRPIEGIWGKAVPKRIERVGVLTQQEIIRTKKAIERMLYDSAKELYQESSKLGKDVLALGGVRSYAQDYLKEEYEVIPKRYRRKTGLPLDDLVDNLNEMGHTFENGDHLRLALAALEDIRRPAIAEFADEAERIMADEGVEARAIKTSILKVVRRVKVSKKMYADMKKELLGRFKARITKQRLKVMSDKRKLKTINSIKHRLKTKGLKWGYQEQIAALHEGLITHRMTAAERRSLESYGNWVEEQQAEGVEIYADPEKIRALGKRYLYEMSEAELRELDKTIQSTVHQGRLKNKLLRKRYQRTIDEIANDIGREIWRGEIIPKSPVNLGRPPEKNFLGKTAEFFKDLIRMERFLEYAGQGRDKTLYQHVWLPVNDSYNNYVVNKQKKMEDLGRMLSSGRPNSRLIANEVTNKRINDLLELTPNSYKMAYIYSLTGKGRQHLMSGNGLTKQDLIDIEKTLTDADRADIGKALKMMSDYHPELNEIHRKIYGVDLPRQPAYFHFFLRDVEAGLAEAENMSAIISDPTYVQRALEKGMFKRRKGGTAPLVLDFWGNIGKTIDIFEKYKAMALAERDVRKIINHSSVKYPIRKRYGTDWYRDLREWFSDVVGRPKSEDYTALERMIRYFRLKSPLSLLYLNVTVGIRQTGSLFMGISEVGTQYATPSIMEYVAHPRKIDALIYQKDPVQRYRRIERDIAELISRYKATHIGAIVGKRSVFEKGIAFVIFTDRRTSNAVWWMAYKRSLALNAKKIKDPGELEVKAIRDAQYVVRKTQPAWTMKDLSRLYRQRHELARAATMYQNFPNQIFNYITKDTFEAYRQGKIGKRELISHLWWVMIVGALIYGGSRRWRRPTRKEAMLDILLYPLGIIPLGRQFSMVLESKLLGKRVYGTEFTLPPFIFFNSALQTIAAKTWPIRLKYAIKAVAFAKGIPYIALERFYKGLRDIIKGDTKDWRRLFISEYALEYPKGYEPKKKRPPTGKSVEEIWGI